MSHKLDALTSEQQSTLKQVQSDIQPAYNKWLQHVVQLRKKSDSNYEQSEQYAQLTDKTEFAHQCTRFCIARKWNRSATVEALNKYYQWRIDNNVDTVLDKPPAILENDRVYKLVPHAYYGYTKHGEPIYYEKSGLINYDGCVKYAELDEFVQYHIYRQEENVQKCLQQSKETGQFIDQFMVVQDLKGLALGARKCLHVLKEFVYIDQNMYCERMARVIVMNGPWVLPILWNIVKVWLDARTRQKIVFVKGDVHKLLSKYIEDKYLPTEYGGRDNNDFTIRVYDNSEVVNDKSIIQRQKSAEAESDEYTQTVDIAAGKKDERTIESTATRALYGYSVKVVEHELNVTVLFIAANGNIERVVPTQSVRTEVNGEYQSKTAGTLKVIFDNRHSYFKSKTIQLTLSVADVDDTRAESDTDYNGATTQETNGHSTANDVADTNHTETGTKTIAADINGISPENPAPLPDHIVAPTQ